MTVCAAGPMRINRCEIVNRHCRLMSGSECTTSDLMLVQYQLNYADATKMEHYSIFFGPASQKATLVVLVLLVDGFNSLGVQRSLRLS